MRLSITASAAALTAAFALVAASGSAYARSDASHQPVPPKRMSAVGGSQLARPGTQVKLDPGAPKLPEGLTARSWIVADAESGQVLASHNAHWKLAPASTLKMLFADTLLPKFNRDQVHKVTLKDLADVQPGSSLVGIKEDLTYTVHDLWLGVFLRSGNDAVHVLASMNGGTEKTVREMQAKAEELNAGDTRVVSPDGYDFPGQVSSAYDLTLFARAGLQNADFRTYCSTAQAQFPGDWTKSKSGKKVRDSFAIQNTDRLLTGLNGMTRYAGLAGVKNGYTTNAGNTFTGVAQRNGRTLLVTVMHPEAGGNEVYHEAADLLDWGFSAGSEVQPVGSLAAPRTAASASPSPSSSGGAGANAPQKTTLHTSGNHSDSGIWTALGVAAGALVLLAAAIFLVHRKWPLPGLPQKKVE